MARHATTGRSCTQGSMLMQLGLLIVLFLVMIGSGSWLVSALYWDRSLLALFMMLGAIVVIWDDLPRWSTCIGTAVVPLSLSVDGTRVPRFADHLPVTQHTISMGINAGIQNNTTGSRCFELRDRDVSIFAIAMLRASRSLTPRALRSRCSETRT